MVIDVIKGGLGNIDAFKLFLLQGSQSVVCTKHLRSDAGLHLWGSADLTSLIFVLLIAYLRVLFTGLLRLDNKTFLGR